MRLRELRKAKGMSMKELGKVLGCAESTISQYENGKREPSFETMLRAAEFFGVTVGYLLGNENPPAEKAEGVSDEDIKFALFDGQPVTDAQYEEVKRFAKYVRDRDLHTT